MTGQATKLKSDCCEKYRSKAKACKRCPVFAVMGKKRRKRELKSIRKGLARAARRQRSGA